MEGEASSKRSSAMSVLKEAGQGVAVGVVVGILGSVLIRVTGLGSPPAWVFAVVGAVAAIALSLIAQKVRRREQRGD